MRFYRSDASWSVEHTGLSKRRSVKYNVLLYPSLVAA